tara:strand:+ start:108 stop:947 length:840 start_codon:yes stop_codon:yes gene_type:complete
MPKATGKKQTALNPFQAELCVEMAAIWDATLRPFRVHWLRQKKGFGASVYFAQQSVRRDGFRFMQKSRVPADQHKNRRSLHDLQDRGFLKMDSSGIRGFSIRPKLPAFEVGRALADRPGVGVAVRTLRKIVRAMGPKKPSDVGILDRWSNYTSAAEYSISSELLDDDLGIAYVMGWLEWMPDTGGYIFFEPTAAGRAALKSPPRATRHLPEASKNYDDLYFQIFDRRRVEISECVGEIDRTEIGIIPMPSIQAFTSLDDLPRTLQQSIRKSKTKRGKTK